MNTRVQYEKKRDKLFAEWRKGRPEYEKKGNSFCEDGIINFKAWESQTPKILFLVKENWSEWNPINDGFAVKGKFGLNIARWRYLMNEIYKYRDKNVEYPNDDTMYLSKKLTDIALVEVKKIKNETNKVSKDILSYAKKDADFLKQQIDLINPDIVLTGGTIWEYCTIYPDPWTEQFKTIEKRTCYNHNGRLVIDFFHPSTQKSPAQLFDLLQKLLKQEDAGKIYSIFNNFKWGSQRNKQRTK